MHTRLQARSQALAAQRFGIEIKDIEAMQRYSCLSPLHDTRPDTAALRERVTEIARMIEELGSTAAGPGNYALGRGYLALRDYREGHVVPVTQSGVHRLPASAAIGRPEHTAGPRSGVDCQGMLVASVIQLALLSA
ncbi:MAG: hypothetical protein AB1714_26370 [Acidobacteriota bacterium]